MVKGKKKIIPFFIPHVGCPYICIFCNQNRITGAQQLPTAESITETINEYTLNNAYTDNNVYADNNVYTDNNAYTDNSAYGDNKFIDWEVAFYGGSFSAIPRSLQAELLHPAKLALDLGQIQSIRCSTRPDAVEDDELDFLQSYGITTIELGVQSMDDVILTKAKRGHTVAQVVDAASRIKSRGITLGVQLMPGLPGESWQTLINTAVAVTNLQPAMARIYPVLVIKDTELADMFLAGEYKSLDVELAIKYSTFLKEWLENHGIQVIRTGLQSTTDFDAGEGIVAGPYEQAMGERVISRQWRWRIEALMREHETFFPSIDSLYTEGKNGNFVGAPDLLQPEIIISYPRSFTSKVRGVKQENMKYFSNLYPTVNWCWQEKKDLTYIEVLLPTVHGKIRYIL